MPRFASLWLPLTLSPARVAALSRRGLVGDAVNSGEKMGIPLQRRIRVERIRSGAAAAAGTKLQLEDVSSEQRELHISRRHIPSP